MAPFGVPEQSERVADELLEVGTMLPGNPSVA